jgi:hypothetical protein
METEAPKKNHPTSNFVLHDDHPPTFLLLVNLMLVKLHVCVKVMGMMTLTLTKMVVD